MDPVCLQAAFLKPTMCSLVHLVCLWPLASNSNRQQLGRKSGRAEMETLSPKKEKLANSREMNTMVMGTKAA